MLLDASKDRILGLAMCDQFFDPSALTNSKISGVYICGAVYILVWKKNSLLGPTVWRVSFCGESCETRRIGFLSKMGVE